MMELQRIAILRVREKTADLESLLLDEFRAFVSSIGFIKLGDFQF